MRLVGSLAIHAILVGALLLCSGDERCAPPREIGPTIALIDVAVAPRTVAPTAVSARAHAVAASGGGARATAKPRRAVRRSAESIIGDIRYERVGGDRGEGARGDGGDRAGRGGVDDGDRGDGGDGAGRGGGRGNGIGFGAGGGIAPLPDLGPPPPPPPAERRSKARPPRLIYPARHRELDDAQLFVARVAIDREGYVVGAKLLRGRGGPRDAEASSLIFRFRYAPALDDNGKAIAATIEQPFGVQ